MSRNQSTKPRPQPTPDVITVTKQSAALSQLETAIWLWFHRGDDPLSILALAANANACYDALGAHKGRPSLFRQWVKSKSRTFQDRGNYVYEFIRHGRKDLTESTPYSPSQGEALILDSVECHLHLFGDITPLMNAFTGRFLFERPEMALPEFRSHWAKLGDVQKVARVTRPDFLKTVLELLKKAGRKPPVAMGSTPMGGNF